MSPDLGSIVMPPRVSIARLMCVIGLLGLEMSLLRAWIAHSFGFLGLLLWMLLGLLIGGILTSGPVRRFFAGASLTGMVFWVMILIAPGAILGASWDYLISPVSLGVVRQPGRSSIRLKYDRRDTLNPHDFFDWRAGVTTWARRRTMICRGFPDLQGLLLIPPTLLSIFGGLMAVRHQPRSIEILSLAASQ